MVFCLLPVLFALCDTTAMKPMAEMQKPLIVWSGRYPAAGTEKVPGTIKTEVIGTDEVWMQFWKGRRGDEQAPRVDFTRAVVVVVTWPGMAADSLHLGQRGKHRHAAWVGAWEGRIDGIGYVMGVFPRDGIKDIEGQPLPH